MQNRKEQLIATIANCFPKLRNWTNKDRTQSVSLQKIWGFAFAFRIKLLIILLQYFSNDLSYCLYFSFILLFLLLMFLAVCLTAIKGAHGTDVIVKQAMAIAYNG